jgi:hypothetical protein
MKRLLLAVVFVIVSTSFFFAGVFIGYTFAYNDTMKSSSDEINSLRRELESLRDNRDMN